MKRLALLWVLVVSFAWSVSAAPLFGRGPYSGAPGETSIVVSWMMTDPLPARVEVAPVDATTTEAFPRSIEAPAPSAHGQVDVLIDGLESSTAYVYRVIVQSGPEIVTSPVGRFETAPRPGRTVAFAVLSDTQWQWEGANRLAVVGDAIAFDSARSGGFDFVLHAGDLVETPNAYYWEPWFASFEPMLLAAPFVPVLGNHEKNSVSYYNSFSHPSGAGQNDERWWALHWGDVVVVGLDTSADRADRILEQQAFARVELSGNERWKFVIFHHPVYSSDAYHGSGYGYDKIYHPIFVEAGVDIVFNGHAHNYERIEKDGVVYLVLGGGGAVPRALAPTRVEGSAVAVENHNFYARVTAAPDKVSVDIVSVAEATETTFVPTPGELLDSFTRTAPATVAAEPEETPTTLAPEPAALEPAAETPAANVPTSVAIQEPLAAAATPIEPALESSEPTAPQATESPTAGFEPAKPARPTVTFEPPPPETGGGLGVAFLVSVVALLAAVAWVFLRVGR